MKNNKRLSVQVLSGRKFEALQDDIFVELALPHQQVQTSVCSAEQAEWNEQFVLAANEQDTLQVRLRDTQDKILAHNVLSLCLLPKQKHVQVWLKMECQEGAAIALDLLAEDFGLQWLQEEEAKQEQVNDQQLQQQEDMVKFLNYLNMQQQQQQQVQTPVQQVMRNVRIPPSPLRQANPKDLTDEQELSDDQLAVLYEAIMAAQQQQQKQPTPSDDNVEEQQGVSWEQLLPFLIMQAKQK